MNHILLGHGSGGKLTHNLINDIFFKHFENEILSRATDSATLDIPGSAISFTTDSFVVDPIFFPGGDIGKLAVCGTVNDVAVSGAKPLYLSASFIIEEGLSFEELERIVISMAAEAKKAGVKIVTGDTKVVDKGKCDKVFINTTGIGALDKELEHIGTGDKIEVGDKIIINGSIGDHGMAIMSARNDIKLSSPIQSDCACLNSLIEDILKTSKNIHFMRDATRGGLGTVISELAKSNKYGVQINEEKLPVKDSVRGMCELLGFDPIYVANEGKIVIVASQEDADAILECMRQHELGKESQIIGKVQSTHPGKAWLSTSIGGNRILDMLAGEQLPRIC
ncbi:hydrogenase expression/formation protein HypE [Bacteroidota bacterium]